MDASVLEAQPGTSGEVSHGSTGQHLTGARERGDPGADVDAEPAPIVSPSLALARVEASSDRQPVGREGGDEVERASGGLRRSVEHREHPVAGVLHSRAATRDDVSATDGFVQVELAAPEGRGK
ncbi:MAG: hypothetical protein ACT4OS_12225 [Acidimicrobiales bacterium]